MDTTVTNATVFNAKQQLASVTDHILDNDYNPAIYVGTYCKYNDGSIFGAWLDLTTFDDYDEFIEVCHELHADETDPEMMYQDFMNIPSDLYNEFGMDRDDFDLILEMNNMNDDEREAFQAYIDCTGDHDLQNFRDCYVGHYDSFQDFADEIADEQMACTSGADWLKNYFDYKAFARDLAFDYNESDGYIFSAY